MIKPIHFFLFVFTCAIAAALFVLFLNVDMSNVNIQRDVSVLNQKFSNVANLDERFKKQEDAIKLTAQQERDQFRNEIKQWADVYTKQREVETQLIKSLQDRINKLERLNVVLSERINKLERAEVSQ